jgi:hypothetical protein
MTDSLLRVSRSLKVSTLLRLLLQQGLCTGILEHVEGGDICHSKVRHKTKWQYYLKRPGSILPLFRRRPCPSGDRAAGTVQTVGWQIQGHVMSQHSFFNDPFRALVSLPSHSPSHKPVRDQL